MPRILRIRDTECSSEPPGIVHGVKMTVVLSKLPQMNKSMNLSIRLIRSHSGYGCEIWDDVLGHCNAICLPSICTWLSCLSLQSQIWSQCSLLLSSLMFEDAMYDTKNGVHDSLPSLRIPDVLFSSQHTNHVN